MPYPDLELVLRVKGGPEVAAVPYDGQKYIEKVLAYFNRSRVLPKQIRNSLDPEGDMIANPVTPGVAIALQIVQALDNIAEQEDKAKLEDAKRAENKTPQQWADLVEIKVDLADLIGG